MMADVDVMFVAQKAGAGNNFFPSKVLRQMAEKKALLVAADAGSELARTVEGGGFGLVSPYEDIESLARNLRWFAEHRDEIGKMGAKGLSVAASFERRKVLDGWHEALGALAGGAVKSL